MTFAECAAKSNSDLRFLLELDIGQANLQWVNIGAGIWYVNALNVYTYVDATLLDGFTAQGFAAIGSVQVDAALYVQCNALSDLTTTPKSWYYDAANRSLYLRCVNYNEPFIHNISLGIIYGYSYTAFQPVSAPSAYDGRVMSLPSITKSRDPLFWGKLSYQGGSVTLANTDGFFDRFAIDNDIYGNEARFYLGFDGLPWSEYQQIFTGYIEGITIGEETVEISFTDKRKQLTKVLAYYCEDKNALEAIREILANAYGVTYTDDYYDLTAWAAAEAVAGTVSIDTVRDAKPANELIEGICSSMFGLFLITGENKYSFRFVDTTASAETTIRAYDIMNRHSIKYDPKEVVSSVKVGYAKDWSTGEYTYAPADISREREIFLKYKTYNQRTFDTYGDTASAAAAFATQVLDYSTAVHGVEEITVPMSQYTRELGDIINVEINRPVNTMLGTQKVEVVGVRYNVDAGNMALGIRIV